MELPDIRNYIVIKHPKELRKAMQCDLCRYIIREAGNIIYIWHRAHGRWNKTKYVAFGQSKESDDTVTGIKAYQQFYAYCGRDEIERMKAVYEPIPRWESYEQMHYANIEYINEKIYKPIYEFDANSAFTYGTLQLPDDFDILKEYMTRLFEKKRDASNQITRSKFKNMQNYLVGYFARITEFVRVRSEIIKASNQNIRDRMAEICHYKGTVYLSNTDSIVTDEIGADIMQQYLGNNIGEFKLSTLTDRLCYKSPNAYQLGDKVKYSGVGYFARNNTDFFEDRFATQHGRLITPFDFSIDSEEEYIRLCRVRNGEIEVNITNKIGEIVQTKFYKLGD